MGRALLLLVAGLLLHCLANLFRHLSDNSGALGDAVSRTLLLGHYIVGYLTVRNMIGPCITISSSVSSVPAISMPVTRLSVSLSFSNWRPKRRWHNKKKKDCKTKLHTAHIKLLHLRSFLSFSSKSTQFAKLSTSHADSGES